MTPSVYTVHGTLLVSPSPAGMAGEDANRARDLHSIRYTGGLGGGGVLTFPQLTVTYIFVE